MNGSDWRDVFPENSSEYRIASTIGVDWRWVKTMGLTPDELDAFHVMRRGKGEEFLDYLKRVKRNELARVVRYAQYRARDDEQANFAVRVLGEE